MPALNLRFDLKRLSDSDLAARFEAKAAEREAIRLMPFPLASNDARRICIRHPSAYRAAYLIGGAAGAGVELLPFWLAVFAGFRSLRRWALDTDGARAYLLNCELLDVMDELKRRVPARRRSCP